MRMWVGKLPEHTALGSTDADCRPKPLLWDIEQPGSGDRPAPVLPIESDERMEGDEEPWRTTLLVEILLEPLP
jgi:hypothetical protein